MNGVKTRIICIYVKLSENCGFGLCKVCLKLGLTKEE